MTTPMVSMHLANVVMSYVKVIMHVVPFQMLM